METVTATPRPRPHPAVTRTAVITGPGVAALTETQMPVPERGQVRIRVEGSGVCGSSLPVWEGRDWFEYPLAAGAPGHEAWGVIDAVGDGVDDVGVGTRVAALSYNAFAAYDIAAAESVVPLPAALDGQPFPGEALGCAMNVLRRSNVERGQTVAIVGIGFLGALLTQLVTRAGANVIAISRRPFALEIARMYGAAETLPLDSHEGIINRVRDRTDGRFCDRVIEVTGHQWPLDLAGELTCERGRLIIAGFHQDGPRQVNMFLWNWRGIDVINAHERDPRMYVQGIRDAAAAVASGVLDPAALYTHRFPLDRTADALETLRTRPGGFMKALIEP